MIAWQHGIICMDILTSHEFDFKKEQQYILISNTFLPLEYLSFEKLKVIYLVRK